MFFSNSPTCLTILHRDRMKSRRTLHRMKSWLEASKIDFSFSQNRSIFQHFDQFGLWGSLGGSGDQSVSLGDFGEPGWHKMEPRWSKMAPNRPSDRPSDRPAVRPTDRLTDRPSARPTIYPNSRSTSFAGPILVVVVVVVVVVVSS